MRDYTIECADPKDIGVRAYEVLIEFLTEECRVNYSPAGNEVFLKKFQEFFGQAVVNYSSLWITFLLDRMKE
jgi:hypothetical protein